MRKLFLTLLLGTIGQCYGSVFDPDTVDNWQIYNGTNLLLAGNSEGEFQAKIKKADLRDLRIKFNHCFTYVGDFYVTIEITDEKGKIILTKKFKIKSGDSMIILKKELGELTTKILNIRYIEKKENATDIKLGQIRLE